MKAVVVGGALAVITIASSSAAEEPRHDLTSTSAVAPSRPGRGLANVGIGVTISSVAFALVGGGFAIASTSACCSDSWGFNDKATFGFASLGFFSGSVIALSIGIPLIVVGNNERARAKVSVGPRGLVVFGEF